MSDTPRTDALREVVIQQYKEDELSGIGMGNTLAALLDIESLERERHEWAERWADLSRAAIKDIGSLERERDLALEQRDKIAKAIMRHLKYAENHHRNEVEDDIDEQLRAALTNVEIVTHDRPTDTGD